MNKHVKLAITALEQMRGDNLYMAKYAFRNCTPEQMQAKYGQSDRTRQEILDGYQKLEDEINEAIKYLSDETTQAQK